jgi:hypothetical protein
MGDAGEHGRQPGGNLGGGHLKAFSLTARTPIAYTVWGTITTTTAV